MAFLAHYIIPEAYDLELKLKVEDAFDDSEEIIIAKAVRDTLKTSIYQSLDAESKENYYNYYYRNGKNCILYGPKIEEYKNNCGYFFDVRFYIFGKLRYIRIFICVKKSEYNFYAAYDTDDNVLFLPILNNYCVLTCDIISKIDNFPWLITHEIKHKIDFDNATITDDDLKNAENQSNKINLRQYYNNKVEYPAFYNEMLEFLISGILTDNSDYIEIVRKLSNQNTARQFLDDLFLEDEPINGIGDNYIPGEEKELSKYYKNLTRQNKDKLVKNISNFFNKIIKSKFESIEKDFKHILIDLFFTEFRAVRP